MLTVDEKRARILLVDDDPNVLAVLDRGLSMAGYECVKAMSAGDGEHYLADEHFELMLLDVNMPGKSGMELLPEVRFKFPDVGVIMLTGERDVALGTKAMNLGAFDYALKPVSLAELVVRIENALSRRTTVIQTRAYQSKLELMVEDLSARLEERDREMNALRQLFDAQKGQGETAQTALVQLQDTLTRFKSEVEGLITVVGFDNADQPVHDKETNVELEPDWTTVDEPPVKLFSHNGRYESNKSPEQEALGDAVDLSASRNLWQDDSVAAVNGGTEFGAPENRMYRDLDGVERPAWDEGSISND